MGDEFHTCCSILIQFEKLVWPLQVNYAQIRNDIRLQSKIFILVVKKRKNFALKKQVLRFQKFNRQRDMSKKMTLALSASYISFLYCISLKKIRPTFL